MSDDNRLIAVLIAIIAFVIIFYLDLYFAKVRKDLELMATRESVIAKITELREQNTSLKEANADLTQQLAALQTKFDALNSEETEVIAQLDKAQQSQGDVDAIDAAIDGPPKPIRRLHRPRLPDFPVPDGRYLRAGSDPLQTRLFRW